MVVGGILFDCLGDPLLSPQEESYMIRGCNVALSARSKDTAGHGGQETCLGLALNRATKTRTN